MSHEITYTSNPGFIFHDSCGFEAASTAELDNVRVFIEERARKGELKDQLHAIW
jgi:hypothetical protein